MSLLLFTSFRQLVPVDSHSKPPTEVSSSSDLSDILNTGFQLNPEVNVLKDIKLVVKVEDIMRADELLKIIRPDFQKEYAKKVAENLYNFISSYDEQIFTIHNKQVECNIVPKDVFERWMAIFEKKYNFDKNFLLK